jgi:very-short-patch-repair endonuclease
VTAAQARAIGLTDDAVRHRLAVGRWTRAGRGVYRVAGAPRTEESVLLALVLAAGPGAVVSHRTAAWLWGLDGVRRGPPELTVPLRRGIPVLPTPPGLGRPRVHRSTDLHLTRPVERCGIPTTDVARTLLDLGAVVDAGALHLAVDDARRRGLADWDALLGVLVAHARKGRRGAGALRALLDAHAAEMAVTDSGFERLMVAALVTAGLPPPAIQHWVVVGGARYRLDLAYPDRAVAIELDGGDHLRRHVWEADHVRQNGLVLAGWTVLRFTWRDYVRRRPAVVAEVRAALARPSL